MDEAETLCRQNITHIRNSMEMLINAAADLIQIDPDADLDEVDAAMEQLVRDELEQTSQQKAIAKIRRDRFNSQNRADLLEEFLLEKEKAHKSVKISLKKHALYKEYTKKLWCLRHPDEPFPEDDDDDEVGEDVEMTGANISTKCPISMRELEDPYTSDVCGHTVSYQSLVQYLQNGPKRCPQSGCSNLLRMPEMRPNKLMARELKRIEFSQQTQNS